ncbi:MAG TPA: CsbD family protein [Stellaceae bacterium]
MDKDRIEGVAKKVSGGIKEAAGKALGDTKTEADGRAEKAEGRVQNAIGGLKDAARELIGGGDRK